MKSTFLLAAIAFAGTAAAQSVTVDEGRWTMTTDTGGYVIQDGIREDLPAESDSLTECWITPEDRTISEETMGLESCTFNSKARYGQRLEFEMTCEFDGVEMDGDMIVLAAPDGESALASVLFEAGADGTEVFAWSDMWVRRVGAC